MSLRKKSSLRLGLYFSSFHLFSMAEQDEQPICPLCCEEVCSPFFLFFLVLSFLAHFISFFPSFLHSMRINSSKSSFTIKFRRGAMSQLSFLLLLFSLCHFVSFQVPLCVLLVVFMLYVLVGYHRFVIQALPLRFSSLCLVP